MEKLITRKIERISKDVLVDYWREVTELIGRSHGVYALYDEDELYYVGKAVDLKRRVKQHLKDRHLAQWNYFSIFLVSEAKHVDAIEMLLIRISNPKGNRVKPSAGLDNKLKKELKRMIKKNQEGKLDKMFDTKKKSVSSKSQKDTTANPNLEGRFNSNKMLWVKYKGVEYKAILLKTGKIRFEGVEYKTPTAAALVVVDSRTRNGWTFWYIQNDDNNWVKLKHLND